MSQPLEGDMLGPTTYMPSSLARLLPLLTCPERGVPPCPAKLLVLSLPGRMIRLPCEKSP